MARTLTRPAYGFTALRASHAGLTYNPIVADGKLLPLEVRHAMAPRVATATLALDLTAFDPPIWPWQWKGAMGMEDRVAIRDNNPTEASRLWLFAGHVVDVDQCLDPRTAHVAVTATGLATRLDRDFSYLVSGRYMLSKAGDVRHYSGLPCCFNAGGLPNRAPALQTDTEAPVAVGVFTADHDPTAEWWTPAHIFDYLLWRYNGAEEWLANPLFSLDEYARTLAAGSLSVEGMSLWRALGCCADRLGYDVYESYSGGADPSGGAERDAAGEIVVLQRNTRATKTVKRQVPDGEGVWPQMDLALTTVPSLRLSESVSSCVARPVAAGGQRIIEITVPLQPAWKPAELAVSTDGSIPLPSSLLQHNRTCQYALRYTKAGGNFLLGGSGGQCYQDCGRLWDANSDGRYSGAPWGLSQPDIAALAGDSAGSWPSMPHEVLPCISGPSELLGFAGGGAFLEISWDDGGTWSPYPGAWKAGSGRLAVRLDDENLADLVRPLADGAADPLEDNLFYRLLHAGDLVDPTTAPALRLTCCVAAPDRHCESFVATTMSGTVFETTEWLDRGAMGQVRKRAASSVFAAAGLWADESSGAQLAQVATAARDAAEARQIEANLGVEWPDEPIVLGDRISKIAGMEYDLGVTVGLATRYPRVVGLHWQLDPHAYAMQILLDTWRHAGVV